MNIKQKTFDKIVSHLRKQNATCQAVDEKGVERCLYRGPNGMSCAIGCLIPDDEYSQDLEGLAPYSLRYEKKYTKDYLYTETKGNIIREIVERAGYSCEIGVYMQVIHDTYEPKEWEEEFQKVAKDQNLKYTEPYRGIFHSVSSWIFNLFSS